MRHLFPFLAVSMLACSSAKADPPNDDASERVGAGPTDCPRSAPGVGEACSKEDAACEYGGDFSPACNTWLTCSNGGWRTTTLTGVTNPTCPTATVPTTPPNPASCPAVAPRTSDACGGAVECNYADTTCACPDGFWNCSTGKQFCKTPRPRIGTPCKPLDECAIEINGPCDRIVLTCGRDNTWTASKAVC